MFSEQLKRQPYAPVNLEVEAQKWLKGRGLAARKNLVARGNPLLNPDICQTMVEDLHRRLNIAWSYGGWMENRPYSLERQLSTGKQKISAFGIGCKSA